MILFSTLVYNIVMAEISVIVPIYNGKAYIHRCVDSIINQTFSDLEIILVDDGSTDGCSDICDDYAKEDERIKVIHQENQGLSAARNAGVKLSTSPYIAFVDCDDYISLTMYEGLIYLIKKTKADIACCNVDVFDDLGHKRYFNPNITDSAIWRGQDIFHYHVVGENRFISTAAWDKLYKREIVLSKLFEPGQMYEDLRVMSHWLTKCKKVAYTGQAFYHYYDNRNSLTHGLHFNKKWLTWFDANKERIEVYKKYSPDNIKYIYATYVDNALSIMYKARHHHDLKPVRKEIRTEMFRIIKENDDLPLNKKCKHKLRLFRFWRPIYYLSMDGYEILRRIIHK